jgi:hypothetical protein
MLANDNLLHLPTKTHSLKSNEPLFLDDPNLIWQIQSGSLAIFAMSTEAAVVKGRRRYLFNLKPGEVMFPTSLAAATTSLDAPCQLVAVALEPVVLAEVSQQTFVQRLELQSSLVQQQFQGWITHLGSTLSGIVPTTLPIPLTRQGLLIHKEVFQPGQGELCLVRLLHGQADLLGMTNLTLTPEVGWVPLVSQLWLQAGSTVELDIGGPENVTALLAGLHELQTRVLRAIQILEARENQQEYQRFQAREQLNQQAVTETLQSLAGVFDPIMRQSSEPEDLESGDALLRAVGAVGHALGIPICPPAESEDLGRMRDPLDAIARASHIRLRQVSLRDRWWQQDSGPLLAYTLEDNQPVALLPVNDTRYDCYDPVRGTRTAVRLKLPQCWLRLLILSTGLCPADYNPGIFPDLLSRDISRNCLLVVIMGITVTLLGMVTPQATGILIDQAIPNADRRLLVQIALGLLLTTTGTALFQLTRVLP